MHTKRGIALWVLGCTVVAVGLVYLDGSFALIIMTDFADRFAMMTSWQVGALGFVFGLALSLAVTASGMLRSRRDRKKRTPTEDKPRSREDEYTHQIRTYDVRFSEFLKSKGKYVDSMDKRIKSLLEEHPWIVALSETDFVPGVRVCSIALTTAKQFMSQGKHRLVYEYLSSCLSNKDTNDKDLQPVDGSLDDFCEMIHFCEADLLDPHLALCWTRYVYQHHPARLQILPELCRRLIRAGELAAAKARADELRRIIIPPFWRHWKIRLAEQDFLRNRPTFALHGNLALALFYAAVGNSKQEAVHWQLAEVGVGSPNKDDEIHWASVERAVYTGQYERAKELISEHPFDVPIPQQFAYLRELLISARVVNDNVVI